MRSCGHEQRLGARAEHAVAALELRPVDGEVGLVDQLVRVGAVLRVARDADRDRGPDRLARGLDVEVTLGDGTANPLCDLERLLGGRLGQQDRELLAAEARRDVVVAQLGAEDLCDPLQDRVSRQVAVVVVDVAKQVEVGHDQRQRPLEALCPAEFLLEGQREVARVEEAGLRIDARLGLQRRHRERAVHEQDRGDGERDQPRVLEPEVRERDAERREHELRGEVLEAEQAGCAGRVAVREVEHHREQRMVDEHEHGTRREPGDRKAQARVRDPARVEDQLCRAPRRHHRDDVVRDVERLQGPAVAVLQPLGDVHEEHEQRELLGRQDQRRRHEEDDRRVVRLVARRAHHEELRDGSGGREDGEREPVRRAGQPSDERQRDRGGPYEHEQHVGARDQRQAFAVGPLVHRVERCPCRLEQDLFGRGGHRIEALSRSETLIAALPFSSLRP